MTSPVPEASEPKVLFRPGKKRKIYRQRPEDADGSTTTETTNEKAAATVDSREPRHSDSEEEGLSVAEVLRRRNARKVRLGGVAFRAAPTSRKEDDEVAEDRADQSLVPHRAGDNPVDSLIPEGYVKRFASQTGLVGELVNKHMEEYIESELARRQRHANESAAAQAQAQFGGKASGSDAATSLHDRPALMQPALRGKLQEIDLGEEARERNVAMTERARRRLEGASVEDEEMQQQPKPVRLGKDGKPLRSKDRRDSDAIKRDQMVEEFLRENRLDVYDIDGAEDEELGALDEEGAADEKLVEQFRREFVDALNQRRQRRRPATNAPPRPAKGVVKKEGVLKGPKLGGSRNVRAAMRDILLKEQQEKQR